MKRVNINISDELHTAVKIKSAQSKVSIQAAVELFLSQWSSGKVELPVGAAVVEPSQEREPKPSHSKGESDTESMAREFEKIFNM